ncbi:collagen alpha-1(XXVI) chain-like [Penaeus monodon]|uniref:collagen alpha-1(XXVI) chain-like n=1 Tax=Penaeus monodon TaxID=6687 RepID=UPI0018A78B9E|nr:collagen alpha-1(XXVI) chain-like [Penaeus monodon]
MREWCGWWARRCAVTAVIVTVTTCLLLPPVSAYRRRGNARDYMAPTKRNIGTRGNFCPYTVTKMVSCKIANGTQTNGGGWALGKKGELMTMTRPRYVTSFKEVQETEYGCCPGFYGSNCDTTCFNCTQIQHLESRVRTGGQAAAISHRVQPAL